MNALSSGTKHLLFYQIAKILNIAEIIIEGVKIYLNVINRKIQYSMDQLTSIVTLFSYKIVLILIDQNADQYKSRHESCLFQTYSPVSSPC